ncbi:hypothetical protein CLCR_01771 [Cladophialophora carrionii]|uniref:Uncharacterized protein n=1 Tax=Cladophialophora carrionii TaxID=86049 RepID=A0A1C1CAM8_9EURO|nr:hypothetical protein CLCR_01771 [Cladophialophora carrionii]
MFAIRGHKGLKRLIISNSPCSMKLWVESCNEWRKRLPEEVEKALQRHEKDKTYDDPECRWSGGSRATARTVHTHTSSMLTPEAR